MQPWIQFIWEQLALVCDGETETLFASAERVNGNVTKEFDMKCALYAIVLQHGVKVDNGARVVHGTPVGWSGADHSAAIDNNTANGGEVATGVTIAEMIIDFGSAATRIIRLFGQVKIIGSGPSSTSLIRVSYSTDDISYTGLETLITITSGQTITLDSDAQGTSTNFRYVKIEGVGTGALSEFATIREVYAEADTGGITDLTFEIKDSARSTWVDMPISPLMPTINPMLNGDPETSLTQLGVGQAISAILPGATSGGIKLIRAKLTTTKGKSDTSVVIIKVNTQT